ncbi:expressed unknown protein [Seminavis robusta]|uniref:Uncharacterized protein n=1 Tax=Seminavis robusta TaxID=568900 RepID=A0A9N8HK01_9STRA|nr:expressed unknown protein [Seminavis robusta]|eukprot:Sro720_g192610.1 n/a (606) ;mRNA; r:25874-27691
MMHSHHKGRFDDLRMSYEMSHFEKVNPFPQQGHDLKFEALCSASEVNPVNHGEFEKAAEELCSVAKKDDKGMVHRCEVMVLQRCRRGGKTFMLHAVADLVKKRVADLVKNGEMEDTHVIHISLNSQTRYRANEDPRQAILSRIAYELDLCVGETRSFNKFHSSYKDFDAVSDWLEGNRVILLIDELNVIQPGSVQYDDMSHMLDDFVGRLGCALMYSTHHRSYADILRGREGQHFRLSTRNHNFFSIPRVRNQDCLNGLRKANLQDPSLWSAVLRGRIPCLILTKGSDIARFADISFEREVKAENDPLKLPIDDDDFQTKVLNRRIQSLKSTITGTVTEWEPNVREEFKAYSYMAEQKGSDQNYLYVWPPFLLASKNVLGKDYRHLFETLCSPEIEAAKAFEALSELAVLIRLLSSHRHSLVPHHEDIRNASEAFEATEMYFVHEDACTLADITQKVEEKFSHTGVMQAVVVPLCSNFPIYDFFLFHRKGGHWKPAAGYQCKLGYELPDQRHAAWEEDVSLSVWIGGSCRQYRVEGGTHVAQTKKHGWVLMGGDAQFDMLGVSISEALPQHVSSVSTFEPITSCCAEKSVSDRRAAASAKKQKTE